MSEVTVRDNVEAHRYEALRDEKLVGEIDYRTKPGVVVLVHTEVIPEVEGTGVASELVRSAFADIRARNMRMLPICPYVVKFLRRHPEYNDLVAARPGEGEARASE